MPTASDNWGHVRVLEELKSASPPRGTNQDVTQFSSGERRPSDVVAQRNPIAALIYYLVCALLFPATLAGCLVWIGKLDAARKSGVSGTAQGPLSARWFQHRLGTRDRDREVSNDLPCAGSRQMATDVRVISRCRRAHQFRV
jgi:hypothetical protein